MSFIVIGENQDDPQQDIDMLNSQLDDGKHIFLFTYLDNCGPCNQTKPKWDSMKHKIKNNNEKKKKNIIGLKKGNLKLVIFL